MKKFLFLGLAALGLGLVIDRPADAWVNSKFSIGLNWHRQSGGNNLLWGVFRNGQVPGPEGGGFHGGYLPHGDHAPTFPGFHPAGPNEFQYFGQKPQNQNGNQPNPQPAAAAAQQPQAYGLVPNWYNQSLYQAVNYTPNYYYPADYSSTGNFYPGYYGYFQPPSYWFGR